MAWRLQRGGRACAEYPPAGAVWKVERGRGGWSESGLRGAGAGGILWRGSVCPSPAAVSALCPGSPWSSYHPRPFARQPPLRPLPPGSLVGREGLTGRSIQADSLSLCLWVPLPAVPGLKKERKKKIKPQNNLNVPLTGNQKEGKGAMLGASFLLVFILLYP